MTQCPQEGELFPRIPDTLGNGQCGQDPAPCSCWPGCIDAAPEPPPGHGERAWASPASSLELRVRSDGPDPTGQLGEGVLGRHGCQAAGLPFGVWRGEQGPWHVSGSEAFAWRRESWRTGGQGCSRPHPARRARVCSSWLLEPLQLPGTSGKPVPSSRGWQPSGPHEAAPDLRFACVLGRAQRVVASLHRPDLARGFQPTSGSQERLHHVCFWLLCRWRAGPRRPQGEGVVLRDDTLQHVPSIPLPTPPLTPCKPSSWVRTGHRASTPSVQPPLGQNAAPNPTCLSRCSWDTFFCSVVTASLGQTNLGDSLWA